MMNACPRVFSPHAPLGGNRKRCLAPLALLRCKRVGTRKKMNVCRICVADQKEGEQRVMMIRNSTEWSRNRLSLSLSLVSKKKKSNEVFEILLTAQVR